MPGWDPVYLCVGVLGRPHGIAGDVTVHLAHAGAGPDVAGLRPPVDVMLETAGGRQVYKVTSLRGRGTARVLTLVGCGSREAAAALTHARVLIARATLPALDAGEFYVEDLVGCSVVDGDGRTLGIAETTFWNGAHDVLGVRGTDGGETLIPVVPAFIRRVEADNRRVIVDLVNDDTHKGDDDDRPDV